MKNATVWLVPRQDPGQALDLDPARPFSIGRDPGNTLCLADLAGLSRHHAVIRVSRGQGSWILCDLGSVNGTFLEGEQIQRCRPLADGDEIRFGPRGPVYVFRCTEPRQRLAPPAQLGGRSQRAQVLAGPDAVAPSAALDVQGRSLPLDQIRSAFVRSPARYPQIFSWWLLASLGGLLLLPFPWLFWPTQLAALAGWIVLGSLREHILVITLQDGMAYRHWFSSKATALAHRNGIRRAIGQPAASADDPTPPLL